MNSTPAGWPRISSCLIYSNPRAAIDWLCQAFGFEVRLMIEGEDGAIHHSELVYGDGLIMVGGSNRHDSGKEAHQQHQHSPLELHGANTQSLCVFVDDVDGHCASARNAGAQIDFGPKTNDYGDDYWTDRTYGAVDLEGHQWWFMQRLRSGSDGK